MNKVRIIGFDSLAETLDALARTTERISFINGGTDFINWHRRGRAESIVDLSRVQELKYIKEESGLVRIGAGTTFAEIAANKIIRTKVAALAHAAAQLGSVQIRNRATIGGNIATASPAGDSLPALAVFDACIVTQGPGGERKLNLRELICGIGKTSLQEKELIKEIILPADGSKLSAFRKVGNRSSVTIARVSLAVLVGYNPSDNTISSGKAAMGALGADMVCPPTVEKFMAGRKVDNEFVETLARLLSEAVDQAIPDRESRPYKAQAVKGLAFDIMNDLFGDKFNTL